MSSPPPTLIIFAQVWPEPRSSAAGWHLLAIATSFVDKGYSVTLACAAEVSPRSADLARYGIEPKAIKLNDSAVDQWLAQSAVDVVIFDRFMLEEQFGWRVRKHAPDALCILDSEDLHCLRIGRQKHPQHAQQSIDNDTALREIAAIHRVDLSLIISELELDLLQQRYNIDAAKLLYLPFMHEDVPMPSPAFASRRDFISVGNFKHPPNKDSLQQLSILWPQIRNALPEAKLKLYGAYADHQAMRLHRPEIGFEVIGPVDDIDAVLKNARLLLAPLRFGAGIKGKLFDAMRCNTPSLTTSIGCEAMGGEQGWPGAITHTDSEFVSAAIELYQNPSLWQQASDRAAVRLNGFFAANAHRQRLMQGVEQLQHALAAHRKKDFVGQMLRHQHHGYHHYMAKWIEAKNKPANSPFKN